MMTFNGLKNYYGTKEYIGALLRLARQMRGVSIRELADNTGYNKATIVNLEKGAFGARIDILQDIAKELEINVSFGALSEELINVIESVGSDLIEVVKQWCVDRVMPATNDAIVYEYRQLNEQNECNINYIEDELGELATMVMLSYAVEFAISLSEDKSL